MEFLTGNNWCCRLPCFRILDTNNPAPVLIPIQFVVNAVDPPRIHDFSACESHNVHYRANLDKWTRFFGLLRRLRYIPNLLAFGRGLLLRAGFLLVFSLNLIRKKWKSRRVVGWRLNDARLVDIFSGHSIRSPASCVCSNMPLAVEAK